MKNLRRWTYKALMDVTGLSEEEAKLLASAPDLFEALLYARKELKRLEIFFKKTQENAVSALALGLIDNALELAESAGPLATTSPAWPIPQHQPKEFQP